MKNSKTQQRTIKMVLSAFFLALAYVLPFLTGQIPEIGAMLCPMHIPVLICGFVCGWYWGLSVGAIAPLLRSLILGKPVLFPSAIAMCFELAAYGAIAGLMYKYLPKKRIYVYCSLVIAMVVGRCVWGLATLVLLGVNGGTFGIKAFMSGAVLNSLPGIALQIILIPVVVMVLEKIKPLKMKESVKE